MRELTSREYSLFRGLLAGKRDKEIAFDLGLALSSIRGYVHDLLVKLGLENRVQLVIWAYARPKDLKLWPSNQK